MRAVRHGHIQVESPRLPAAPVVVTIVLPWMKLVNGSNNTLLPAEDSAVAEVGDDAV
jgi:hypothetical protein